MSFKENVLNFLGQMSIKEQTFSQTEDGERRRHRLLHEPPNRAKDRLRASAGGSM